MKTIPLLFLLALLLVTKNSFAQDSLRVAPPLLAESILGKLNNEVALSGKQKTEVRKLLLERSENFRLVQQAAGSKKLTKADFKQANEQAYNKLKAALTPEQYAKVSLLRQEAQRQKAAYREEEVYKSLQDIELDF